MVLGNPNDFKTQNHDMHRLKILLDFSKKRLLLSDKKTFFEVNPVLSLNLIY
jgi:hypothetical protein